MTEDQELRIECVKLVQRNLIDTSGVKLIEVAQKYYWFITAKDKEEN